MPIGGVAAYPGKVSVVGVGFDIACGNAAIRTNLALHGTPGEVLHTLRPLIVVMAGADMVDPYKD